MLGGAMREYEARSRKRNKRKEKRGQTLYKILIFVPDAYWFVIRFYLLMDLIMRTTIDIDEQLLVYAKLQAAQQGCTLKQVIEDALREFFSGLKPGIDLDNSRSLSDIMDDR